MWPLSQNIQLSLVGKLSEFSSLLERRFKEVRVAKTCLTKIEIQNENLLLKFERTLARSIYADAEVKAFQAKHSIVIQGKSKIPLGHFLFSLYFPIMSLFLLALFKDILFIAMLLAVGFFVPLFSSRTHERV
jgi:hypothetical protein